MGKHNRLKNRVIAIAVMIIITVSLSACSVSDLIGSNNGPIRCLFIGNSITYYNNMPEMYQNIVEAATGREAEVTENTYSGRKTKEHAQAIGAVLRSRGKSERLTDAEKQLFVIYKGNGTYQESVFQDYAEALHDENGKKKKFDYIIIQDHGRDLSYEDSREGAIGITDCLADKKTSIVLCMPNYRMKDMELSEVKKIQDGYDLVEDQVAEAVRESGLKVKDVRVAYEGRAFLNYAFYFGKGHAIEKAPEEYTVYKEEKAESQSGNCLLVSEDLHASQLGSYLQAATIYAAAYGESAEDTVASYKATVTGSVDVIGKKSDGRNYAIKNGAFDNEDLLKEAWFIADQTENHGMNLYSASEAEKWKENSSKPNE